MQTNTPMEKSEKKQGDLSPTWERALICAYSAKVAEESTELAEAIDEQMKSIGTEDIVRALRSLKEEQTIIPTALPRDGLFVEVEDAAIEIWQKVMARKFLVQTLSEREDFDSEAFATELASIGWHLLRAAVRLYEVWGDRYLPSFRFYQSVRAEMAKEGGEAILGVPFFREMDSLGFDSVMDNGKGRFHRLWDAGSMEYSVFIFEYEDGWSYSIYLCSLKEAEKDILGTALAEREGNFSTPVLAVEEAIEVLRESLQAALDALKEVQS